MRIATTRKSRVVVKIASLPTKKPNGADMFVQLNEGLIVVRNRSLVIDKAL